MRTITVQQILDAGSCSPPWDRETIRARLGNEQITVREFLELDLTLEEKCWGVMATGLFSDDELLEAAAQAHGIAFLTDCGEGNQRRDHQMQAYWRAPTAAAKFKAIVGSCDAAAETALDALKEIADGQ